jgi:hypothetical protein
LNLSLSVAPEASSEPPTRAKEASVLPQRNFNHPASKQLREEFDKTYDTFLADIPNAPEELTLAKAVISHYLYETLLRKLFHSRAAENVNQYKDLHTSRHASKNKLNHLRTALKVVAANKAGSAEKTATKNKKKRKFTDIAPQFLSAINLAAPPMRIDDAAMEEAEAEEAEAEAEEAEAEEAEEAEEAAEEGEEEEEEEQEEDSAEVGVGIGAYVDIHEDEDIEWWKSLDDDIDIQNNENESMLENLASYYNSIVHTVSTSLSGK